MGFGSLNINFDQRQKEGGDQRSCHHTDQSKSLDPSQHRKEEEQRMNIGSGTYKKWPEKIVHHTDDKYSQTEQEKSF